MKRTAVALLTGWSLLFAIDWSDRSTQELLAALKRAEGGRAEAILHELKKRTRMMTPQERRIYERFRRQIKESHGR